MNRSDKRDVHKFINSCFLPVTLPFLWIFFLSFTKISSAGCGSPVLSAIPTESPPRQLIISWTFLPFLYFVCLSEYAQGAIGKTLQLITPSKKKKGVSPWILEKLSIRSE
jgi:hypothetical protein